MPEIPAPGSLLRSPWPLRVLWVLLPVLLGPSVADALADRSRAVQVVASSLAWIGWLVGVAALAVLRSATLTVARAIVPAALPLSVWAAVGADRPIWAAVGVASGAAAIVALATPGLSDAFVDGSSYGTEQRVSLRIPLPILLVPVPLAWSLAAAGVVGGPLLLATEQWVAGGVVTVAGLAVAVAVARQLHTLSRRWLVFVPAGLVVHDPLALSDAILFPRHLLERVGPATEERASHDDVVDTSAGALGLVLEIRGREPVRAGIRRGREVVERDGVHAVLVTPTRPAATLTIARETRLPVG